MVHLVVWIDRNVLIPMRDTQVSQILRGGAQSESRLSCHHRNRSGTVAGRKRRNTGEFPMIACSDKGIK